MIYCIRTFLVFIFVAIAGSGFANPEFLALVNKATPTPPGSQEWIAVEKALLDDPFINIAWTPESGQSAGVLILRFNPKVLNPEIKERRSDAYREYDHLWHLVWAAAKNEESAHIWREVEEILSANPHSTKLSRKANDRVTLRTLLILFNQPLYERIFGKFQQPFPKVWGLIAATTLLRESYSWAEVEAEIQRKPFYLEWYPEGGESIRAIIKIYRTEFYDRHLALPATVEEKYDGFGRLGEGYFGVVKLASNRKTGELVAVKQLKRSVYRDARMAFPPREVELLKTIPRPHPHVIQLLEAISTDNVIYLMMEVAGGSELFDYCVERGAMPEPEARFLIRQILGGVDFLHRCGIAHRDLKLENIRIDGRLNIKILDLGLGAFFNENPLNTFCGSPDYASPEIWMNKGYQGPAVDVWAMGVILYMMVTGYMPFNQASRIIAIDYILPEGRDFSEEIKQLLRETFQLENKRLTVAQMIHHPWINNHGRLHPIRRLRTGLEREPVAGLVDDMVVEAPLVVPVVRAIPAPRDPALALARTSACILF
jgi:hypothetical protein